MWRCTPAVLAAVLVGTQPLPAGAELSAATRVVGAVSTYTVKAGDSLTSIGAAFGVDAATIAKDNGFGLNRPLVRGQRLEIDNRHLVPVEAVAGQIVVNIPQRLLVISGHEGVEVMPVAVGRFDWKTPTGAFTVVAMTRNPIWHVPPSIREERARLGLPELSTVLPGPVNPLGEVWIGLSLPGIGIHGTIAPSSIYQASTHGCIRLEPSNARRVFDMTAVGTAGRIIYRPILVAEVDGRIHLEVHQDIYHRLTDSPLATLRALAASMSLSTRIDWQAAQAVVDQRQGIARDVTLR